VKDEIIEAEWAAAGSVAFTVGASDLAKVRIAFRGRMHEGFSDYWDGNWLITRITGDVGGFRFDLPAALRADEVRRFREGVVLLYQKLSTEARLRSMEDWIDLLVTGDGSGRLVVTGSIAGKPDRRNRLEFVIENYDQTFLPPLLAELEGVESRFPVLGAPS
jgi:hypothetical protein